MKKSIKVFSTPFDTAKALANDLTGLINGVLKRSAVCTVALSGGTTPRLLFGILADRYSESVSWESVHFFWVDERCVPPDDDESNYKMAHSSFLGKIKIPSSNIYRIRGEEDPGKEALHYSDVLSENVAVRNGFPCFDIILLGMGEDGHTASIFPGNENLFNSDRSCVPVAHPITGQKRITITGKVINNASDVIIFVTGRNKAGVVEKIINNQGIKKHFPVSYVNPKPGKLTWYLDSEAGSLSGQ